jgi:hypothetical protein
MKFGGYNQNYKEGVLEVILGYRVLTPQFGQCIAAALAVPLNAKLFD